MPVRNQNASTLFSFSYVPLSHFLSLSVSLSHFWLRKHTRAGEIIQWIRYLLQRHENLCSNPQTWAEASMIAHICDPVVPTDRWKAEIRTPEAD